MIRLRSPVQIRPSDIEHLAKTRGVFLFWAGHRYNLTKTKEVHRATDASAINDSDVTNRRATGDYILLYVASDSNIAKLENIVYVHANNGDSINGKQIGKNFIDRFKTHHNDLSISKAVAGSRERKLRHVC